MWFISFGLINSNDIFIVLLHAMFQIDTLSRPLEETNEFQGRITVLHSKLDAAHVQVCSSIMFMLIFAGYFLPSHQQSVDICVDIIDCLTIDY